MASQDDLFGEIRRSLLAVTNTITADTFLKNITPLDRKGDGRLRTWVEELERYFTIANVPDGEKGRIALLTTKGQIGSYIHSIMQANAGINWEDIKRALREYMGEGINRHRIFLELATIRQGRQENVHNYMQRVLGMAERAYAGWGGNDRVSQHQVRDFFVEGLRDSEVKLAVLKAEPDTIDAAYQKAVSESKWKIRVEPNIDSDPEPMEVCYTRRRPHDGSSRRPRNRDFEGHDREANDRIGSRDYQNVGRRGYNTGGWAPPVCWSCGSRGHLSWNCSKRNSGNGPNPFGPGPTNGRMPYRRM